MKFSKQHFLALMLLSGLAACSGPTDQMADSCQALTRLSADACECLAEKVSKDLTPEEFSHIAALTFGSPAARAAANAAKDAMPDEMQFKGAEEIIDGFSACNQGIRTNNLP